VSRFDAAVEDFRWLLSKVIKVDDLLALSGVENLDGEAVNQVLVAAGEFVTTTIAPLSQLSDRIGARFDAGRVRMAPGWHEAFRSWRDHGWPGLSAPSAYGGQGMPYIVQACVATMLGGADLAFAMIAVSARGAISVLAAHADPRLAAICVPRLARGEWTATIAITEAQAGSDVGLISTRASRSPNGSFALTGSKVFISGGDHDLTKQIVHLVLARIEGGLPGTKGLSLFLVPARRFSDDGELLGGNGATVTGIEQKMGLHGSPTCTLTFENSEGILIGAEGAGLATLFTMMNELRLEVALNAIGISASATRHAQSYAAERRQGRSVLDRTATVALDQHPDIQRMLHIMRVLTEGGRALVLETSRSMDLVRLSPSEEIRDQAAHRLEWLLPVCKASLSEYAVEVADLGIQIRGGHGYVSDSGAEQFLRDARVLPIYEGTNGIHAINLVSRTLRRGGGRSYQRFIGDIRDDLRIIQSRTDLTDIRATVEQGVSVLEVVSGRLSAYMADNEWAPLYAAKAYLDLVGRVALGWMWLRIAAAATEPTDAISRDKRKLASFFSGYFEADFQLHGSRVLAILDRPSFLSYAA
jgi:alkylation response protein AidB-like acyl-CoA dehydrogenase